jgi:hypothetical protein
VWASKPLKPRQRRTYVAKRPLRVRGYVGKNRQKAIRQYVEYSSTKTLGEPRIDFQDWLKKA